MFERIRSRMRRLVLEARYIMTAHGQEAMEDDDLTIFDVERCLLTGRIVDRQRDRQRGEWKYLVQGRAIDGARMMAVTKIGPTGRLMILTVYLVEAEEP